MSNSQRRTIRIVGIAAGALLSAPLISLLTSPPASADTDVTTPVITTLGPYPIDGYDETLSYTTSPLALDNYLTATYDSTAFDLDTYFGPSGSGSFEVLLTDPGILQLGVDDVDGSVSYIDNIAGIDFVPTDPGFDLLGGL